MTREEILAGSLEAISRANKDLSEYLINAAQATEAAIEAAVLAERERCARIAEIPHMAQSDIARAIRGK